MAGSQKESSTVHPYRDPILEARLEAIKQLAAGLFERVAVLDRNFNVIYANESAWSEDAAQLSGHQAKCYEAFAHRNDGGELPLRADRLPDREGLCVQ